MTYIGTWQEMIITYLLSVVIFPLAAQSYGVLHLIQSWGMFLSHEILSTRIHLNSSSSFLCWCPHTWTPHSRWSLRKALQKWGRRGEITSLSLMVTLCWCSPAYCYRLQMHAAGSHPAFCPPGPPNPSLQVYWTSFSSHRLTFQTCPEPSQWHPFLLFYQLSHSAWCHQQTCRGCTQSRYLGYW